MEITGVSLLPRPPASTAGAEPFSVEVENKLPIGQSKEFAKHKGDRVIAELLVKAGYTTGKWVFRVNEGVRASSHTPRIQVRRPEHNGVLLQVKPGDNGSCVKGILFVQQGMDVGLVFSALKLASESDNPLNADLAQFKIEAAPADARAASDIVLNKEKLQKLASLPDRLIKVRADIQRAKERKDKIELEIMELEEQEAKLASIDVRALAALLDSVE